MESSLENQLVHIKSEIITDLEEPAEVKFDSDGLAMEIKQEESFPEVIYENIPWKCESENDDNSSVRTLFKYDENMVLKSEIEIDEPILNYGRPFLPDRENKTQKRVSNTTKCLNKKTKSTSGKLKFEPKCDKSNDKEFKCTLCERSFEEKIQMQKHRRNCKGRWYECYICRYSSLHWDWNRFMVHFRKHTGDKPFQCKCCAKRFSSKRMLNFHMKYHPNEILSKCSFCQRRFTSTSEAK